MRVRRVKPNKREHLEDILDFCIKNNNIYFTRNNKRIFIKNRADLYYLLKQSDLSFYYVEDGNVMGLIVLWKALGDNKKRYYIKINADNVESATSLISVLLWNIKREEVFIKLEKRSFLVPLLTARGFNFFHDRGREIIFRRKNDVTEPINTYDKD